MQTRLQRAALFVAFGLLSMRVADGVSLPVVASSVGAVRTQVVRLRALDPMHQYSVLYSLQKLRNIGPEVRVNVEVWQGRDLLASKTLHAGDPDYYAQVRPLHRGAGEIRIRTNGPAGNYSLQVNQWPLLDTVRRGPIHTWQQAMTISLGKTVFASGDDAPYIPVPGTERKSLATDPVRTDWYRIEFAGPTPKLVFFQIDLTERDQIPVNVSVFRLESGKPEEYYEGEDPVTLPHEVQALPGNKFTPRILKPGTYLVSVRAAHPEYKLRTRVYDPPPYQDPVQAVRTGVDYILAAGDSWHANTPRRGGVLDRVSSVHQETSLCVGCHATHFPQRAQLYATRNGYPVVQRQQLQFLSERFYNNPRPLYGFEGHGAVWARMISAPANVLGRMSHLMGLFEEQVSGSPRAAFHRGVSEYLKLYYSGREKLPPDETNGNTPLVSAHEVAWYAWSVTKDSKLGEMIAGGEVRNLVDLCYQTLALAEIGRDHYRAQIDANAKRILSLQRQDGQWSMRFDVKEPAVEFQTGHALWALQAAGVPSETPQVQKAIAFLMRRQPAFGGWMDPLQSFENFRTPFRETQFAVLALSAWFPKPGRTRGWNSTINEKMPADPGALPEKLDAIWDEPAPGIVEQIMEATSSNDTLIRQASTEALGRLGRVPPSGLLGDPSKLVQRTAAWAMRLAHSRRPEMPITDIGNALRSSDDRTRWGASRVFSQHFASLARHPQFADALGRLSADPVLPIRVNAVKGLWQFWFWSADAQARERIENVLLASMRVPQHSWVRENLRHAVYNLADENIRYLYNNWVPLLATAEDRDRVVRGRLTVEARLADKFADVLEHGPDLQKKELLTALTELPLRRGDIYDLEADLSKDAPPVYNRIGNDIEQVVFFGGSAERFARALQPLFDSTDPAIRTGASRAALLVRDTRFGDVNRIAGPGGPAVRSVMAKVETLPEAADVARALKPPPVTVSATGTQGGSGQKLKVKLDEAYFRGYVQPILEKRGKDGYACVHCHSNHTLFNATWQTAMNVVDPSQPEKSLILTKPTSSSESEGVAGASSLAHGGGIRWAKDSPEYVTILEWIKGAKE